MDNAHAIPSDRVLAALGVDASDGLTDAEARRRLAEHGPNELPEEKKPSVVWLFLRQFIGGLQAVLAIAAAIAWYVGEVQDAVGIALALFIDAFAGFVQERRAEGAIERLKKMIVREAAVVRDGGIRRLPVEEIVAGDILIVAEGDRIPADARIIEARELRADESTLTGESAPVQKSSGPSSEDAPIAERTGML